MEPSHRIDLKVEVGTKTKLSTEAYRIPYINSNWISCSKLHYFGTTTTTHRCRCVLSRKDNGDKVFRRIKKRSKDVLFVATVKTPFNFSEMNTSDCVTSDCVTSKQSARRMRTSAAVSESDMFWYDRMAHPIMRIIKEMFRMSQ